MATTNLRWKYTEFIDTTPLTVSTWAQINKGVGSLKTNYSPKIESEAGIADVTASKTFTGIEPEIQFDANDSDDVAVAFIKTIVWGEKIGAAAKSNYLTCDLTVAPVTGSYPAKKRPIIIAYGSAGGDAQKPYQYGGVSLLSQGDAIFGTFNPTTKVFTATV